MPDVNDAPKLAVEGPFGMAWLDVSMGRLIDWADIQATLEDTREQAIRRLRALHERLADPERDDYEDPEEQAEFAAAVTAALAKLEDPQREGSPWELANDELTDLHAGMLSSAGRHLARELWAAGVLSRAAFEALASAQ